MFDISVLFLALILSWCLLRTQGGKGLSIKTEFAPASTAKGKRERRMAWAVLGLMAASVAFVYTHNQNGASWLSLVVPMLVALPLILAPYIKRK